VRSNTLTATIVPPQYHQMEVRIFPNLSRPGLGLKPKRESQRPLLPQHARHCPVLEGGSGLGYLVYPPLDENEAYHVEHQGEGRYQFNYFMSGTDGKWESIFIALFTLPMGNLGMMKEEVPFLAKDSPITPEGALSMVRAFVVPDFFGSPPGAVTLRGATNFSTPEGWDTVYTPIFNIIERPIAPMLVVRVETDWFPHETEFRYVLQPGEGIPGSHRLPIGQVFFISREETVLRDCTEEEVENLSSGKKAYFKEKAENKTTTRYGLQYSPHYINQSRLRNS
jgi:hypothetical protein